MLRHLLKFTLFAAFISALILVPAGTLAYPGGLAFLALFVTGSLAIIFWLAKVSPDLLRERMGPSIQAGQPLWDRIFLSLFMLGFWAWLAAMSWDAARTGFAAVPVWAQVLGAILIVLETAGIAWTFRENTFAAPVVKIQADHRVIDTGPYSYVRHPMYASALLLFVGLPLLLGSWLGLALAVPLVMAMAWRAVREESTLRAELPGYADYMHRVPHRLVPGLW